MLCDHFQGHRRAGRREGGGGFTSPIYFLHRENFCCFLSQGHFFVSITFAAPFVTQVFSVQQMFLYVKLFFHNFHTHLRINCSHTMHENAAPFSIGVSWRQKFFRTTSFSLALWYSDAVSTLLQFIPVKYDILILHQQHK